MKTWIGIGLLVMISLIGGYYSMFWGWASGAGNPPNALALKTYSNVALIVSLCSIGTVVVLAVRKIASIVTGGKAAESKNQSEKPQIWK